MITKFTVSVLLAMVFTISLGLNAAEIVATKEKLFSLKYADGSVEKYTVRWAAIADIDTHEDGHPAIPEKGWFTDTRQCRWSTSGRIERRVYLLNRAGKLFENSEKFVAYHTEFQNEGAGFILTQLRSENCNDSQARRDSDWNDTRQHLRNSLDPTVNGDFPKLINEYKQDATITVEIPAAR